MPRLDHIDHVHIYAVDRGSAEAWYVSVLGLERVPEFVQWAAHGPLFLSNPERTVSLALFQRPSPHPQATVAFRVGGEAFLEWRDHLQASGVALELQDHGLAWSLYFQDPTGNRFEITAYDHVWLRSRLS